MENNRLEELQHEYFGFCTQLIKYSPPDKVDQDSLLTKAMGFHHELEIEIMKQEINFKCTSLREVEDEIALLKTELGMK